MNLILNLKLMILIILKNSFYKNCDYVFHFAGIGDIVPSINDPFSYLNTNVLGTVNVLEK